MHAPKKLMATARALGSTGCVTGGHNKVVRVAEGRVEKQGTPAQVFGAQQVHA
jgi:ABC-type histidine transport system ATPase subunit